MLLFRLHDFLDLKIWSQLKYRYFTCTWFTMTGAEVELTLTGWGDYVLDCDFELSLFNYYLRVSFSSCSSWSCIWISFYLIRADNELILLFNLDRAFLHEVFYRSSIHFYILSFCSRRFEFSCDFEIWVSSFASTGWVWD